MNDQIDNLIIGNDYQCRVIDDLIERYNIKGETRYRLQMAKMFLNSSTHQFEQIKKLWREG